MNVIVTNGCDKRFISLCDQLDAYLDNAIGTKKQHTQYAQHNGLSDIHDVILIEDQTAIAGCGSFKSYDKETAEVKRVFVCEPFRRKHYGHTIMLELEKVAKAKGYKRLILETGRPLKGAIGLYKSLGYEIINNYGPYVHMTESVCMQKQL